jgi:hypothetical protein
MMHFDQARGLGVPLALCGLNLTRQERGVLLCVQLLLLQ